MNRVRTVFLLSVLVPSLLVTISSGISQLEVTISTDKTVYTYRQKVTLNTSLELNLTPTAGLVAAEVDDPTGVRLLTRTITVGNASVLTGISISSIVMLNASGHPTTTFRKGESAWANVTVVNSSPSARNLTTALYVTDNDYTPILNETVHYNTTIASGGNATFTAHFNISLWVSLGTATLYAGVYSDFPSNGGYPLCPEKSATFTINAAYGQALSASTRQALARSAQTFSANASSFSFRLPPYAIVGNYAVSATAYAAGLTTGSPFSTTFRREYQILGDVNFDGKINVLDLVKTTSIYGMSSGSTGWNLESDLSPSGTIDILDVVKVAGAYGQHWPVYNLDHVKSMLDAKSLNPPNPDDAANIIDAYLDLNLPITYLNQVIAYLNQTQSSDGTWSTGEIHYVAKTAHIISEYDRLGLKPPHSLDTFLDTVDNTWTNVNDQVHTYDPDNYYGGLWGYLSVWIYWRRQNPPWTNDLTTAINAGFNDWAPKNHQRNHVALMCEEIGIPYPRPNDVLPFILNQQRPDGGWSSNFTGQTDISFTTETSITVWLLKTHYSATSDVVQSAERGYNFINNRYIEENVLGVIFGGFFEESGGTIDLRATARALDAYQYQCSPIPPPLPPP